MNHRIMSLAILTFLAVTGKAVADETATIRNESLHAVPMYVKWSNLPVESQMILLAPGQVYGARGPDGAALFIRFNATPGSQFPKEVKYRVITGFSAGPLDPGVVSVFRNVSPFEVNLILP
jgi:hypothetical protein